MSMPFWTLPFSGSFAGQSVPKSGRALSVYERGKNGAYWGRDTLQLRFKGDDKPIPLGEASLSKPLPKPAVKLAFKIPDFKVPEFKANPNQAALEAEFLKTWQAFQGQYQGLAQLLQETTQDREKQIEGLTQLIWQQAFENHLMKDIVQSRQQIGEWQASFQTGAPGVIRDGALMILQYLKDHLEEPQTLRQGLRVLVRLILAGGYRKLLVVGKLFSEDAFAKATPVQKGQQLVEALGPMVIKLFQTLSTVPGLFPPHVQDSLTPLYENITPVDPQVMSAHIAASFGKPLVGKPGESVFAEFDPQSMDVGSIAQVYRARLHSGEQVAVKVVKPGVKESIQADLEMIAPLMDLIKELSPDLDVDSLFKSLGDQLLAECDMTAEAQKLTEVGRRLASCHRVNTPRVFGEQSNAAILTMRWMSGSNLKTFLTPENPRAPKLARQYWHLILDQLLYYGAFQSDPHPGNVPYDPKSKRFSLLDGGQMYFIEREQRVAFARLVAALALKQPRQLTQALLSPGRTIAPEAQQAFETWVAEALKQGLSIDNPKAVLTFLTEGALKAQALGVSFQGVDPQMIKCLFVSMMVAKTLDPKAPLARIATQKMLSLFLKHDRRFVGATLYEGLGQCLATCGQWVGWPWRRRTNPVC